MKVLSMTQFSTLMKFAVFHHFVLCVIRLAPGARAARVGRHGGSERERGGAARGFAAGRTNPADRARPGIAPGAERGVLEFDHFVTTGRVGSFCRRNSSGLCGSSK